MLNTSGRTFDILVFSSLHSLEKQEKEAANVKAAPKWTKAGIYAGS